MQAFDTDKRVLAIGSQYHVSFVDPRTPAPISVLSSQENWGVRSLSFKHHLLTVGGGGGTLLFFDMRARAPIVVDRERQGLRTGRGWLRKDANYYAQLSRGSEPPNCVYTHAWDESGSRLFVAGGPLLVGLRGSYAAMWT